MSRFKVILPIVLCFGSSSLLMGMKKEQELTTFKYSNPYFDQELGKTLLLLMQKDSEQENSDHEKLALNKDIITVIAKKNYDLYCEQLFKTTMDCRLYGKSMEFNDFWKLRLTVINNEKRLNKFRGKNIELHDFILMNDKGREIFSYFTLAALANLDKDMIDDMYSSLNWKERSPLKGVLYHGFDNLSSDQYRDMLTLPESLRSKVGELCMAQVSEESKYSLLGKKEYLLQSGIKVTLGAALGAVVFWCKNYDESICLQKDSYSFLLIAALCGGLGSAASSAKDYTELTKDRIEMVNVTKPLVPELEVREKEKAELVDMHRYLMEPVEIEWFQQLPLQLSEVAQANSLQLKYRE